MKKTFFALLLLSNIFLLKAQSVSTETERLNEVMITPFAFFAPALDVSYERLLNEDWGIGINVMADFSSNDDSDESNVMTSQFSPYARMYFGNGFAKGFFVEAFVPITSSKDWYSYNDSDGYYHSGRKNNTTVGLGIGLGGKWVVKRNLIFEISGGVARRFGMDDKKYDSTFTGIGMLGIGYRF
ncbi:MAG: DUF3575 domain-containing protein [Flavobacteriaceae bacterium]|jgi:hypothetical protein|nr:DUF3575 domain-containing protein [Flavobacteriaceae bacterium]